MGKIVTLTLAFDLMPLTLRMKPLVARRYGQLGSEGPEGLTAC